MERLKDYIFRVSERAALQTLIDQRLNLGHGDSMVIGGSFQPVSSHAALRRQPWAEHRARDVEVGVEAIRLQNRSNPDVPVRKASRGLVGCQPAAPP
jgi:hypothetical protein